MNGRKYVISIVGICFVNIACIQNRMGNDEGRKRNWERQINEIKFSDNMKELKLIYSFPNDIADDKNIYIKKAQNMVSDDGKNIYISDTILNRIVVFDANGKFINVIGKNGQGPGELTYPTCLALYKNESLIVNNSGNRRFVLFDNLGRYHKDIKVYKGYISIAIGQDGRIYVTPVQHDIIGKNLADILTNNGEIIKRFCSPITDSDLLNWVHLRTDNKGNVIVFWQFLNYFRMFDSDGDFIREYTVSESPRCVCSAEDNRVLSNNKFNRKYRSVIQSIWLNGGDIYVFKYDPIIEILQYDYSGNIENIYWAKQLYNNIYSDLIVKEINNRKYFYLLELYPENRVSVYSEN